MIGEKIVFCRMMISTSIVIIAIGVETVKKSTTRKKGKQWFFEGMEISFSQKLSLYIKKVHRPVH